MSRYQHSSCICTDRRTLFTMDGHIQFLAPPPISSPLLQHNPSSKYTSYDSPQNPYTPQSTLDSPPFYSNSSSTRPSSTQYHAQAAEPYDPRSFTFDPTHVQPIHKPLSESVPPQFTATLSSCPLPVVPAACPAWLCQPCLAPPCTQAQAQCSSQEDGDLAPAPVTAPSPSPRSAGGSHGHQSHQHQHERYTNVHGIGSGSGSGGSVQLAESPQIRAEALIPLMALGVLEHAGRCMHMVHRCVCTRVFHPLYG